jgi:DtxR family transcriptional regulator, manganese transport regulator
MARPADAQPPKRASKRGLALPHHHPRRTREEHSHEIAQDYVEMIANLIDTTGEARVIDLARRLGVTHVTVARTIKRLTRAELVTSLPYRSIFLTESGRKLSDESRARHETVVDFLKSLGVPEVVAQSDAEGIEHHVSQETLNAFVKHLRKKPRARSNRSGDRRSPRANLH